MSTTVSSAAHENLLAVPRPKDKWQREPWLLLVFGGPLLVVVAALATGFIAWQSSDKLVAGDYYRQGLHIDQDLQRDAKARIYNMQAQLQFAPQGNDSLQLQLRGAAALPAQVGLEIAGGGYGEHGESETRYRLAMRQVQPGLYRVALPSALLEAVQQPQSWVVKLQADDWRLNAAWPHRQTALQLQPAPQ